MKKIVQYLMVLTLSLIATSCYYDTLPAEPVIPLPESVSYSKDVQPLWDQSCISCHKPGLIVPDLTAGNSYAALMTSNNYVVVGNAANSILHKALIGQGAPLMPTAGIWSDSKIAIIDKWINDGALNN